MKKDAQLVLRIASATKNELEKVAALEGRSVAQISEAFLQSGLESYRKVGASAILKWISRVQSPKTKKN